MSLIPRFHGKVNNGEIDFENQEKLDWYLRSLEGSKVDVVIDKPFNKRSMSQNNLYWAYLEEIERETGDFASDLHEYFKRKFLPARFIRVLGKQIRVPASTTNLSKGKMVDYMLNISILTGVPIPDPQEWYDTPPNV